MMVSCTHLRKAQGVCSDDLGAEGVPDDGSGAAVTGLPHLCQAPLLEAVPLLLLPAGQHTARLADSPATRAGEVCASLYTSCG